MNHTTWPGFISGHAVLAAGPEIFQRELSDIYIYIVWQWLEVSFMEYIFSNRFSKPKDFAEIIAQYSYCIPLSYLKYILQVIFLDCRMLVKTFCAPFKNLHFYAIYFSFYFFYFLG